MKFLKCQIFLLFIASIQGCFTPRIIGLWEVEKVEAGSNEVTPNARWIRFNKNKSQASGNGWFQHSIGNWNMDGDALSIENTNGYEDPFGPFQVEKQKDKMIWSRQEEGNEIQVYLKRIESLPVAPANRLLGIWDLTKAVKDGTDLTTQIDPDGKAHLFLRWDQAFVSAHTTAGRQNGIYRTHGHRPEIEFFYRQADKSLETWTYEVDQQRLTLSRKQDGVEWMMTYERIFSFPE